MTIPSVQVVQTILTIISQSITDIRNHRNFNLFTYNKIIPTIVVINNHYTALLPVKAITANTKLLAKLLYGIFFNGVYTLSILFD